MPEIDDTLMYHAILSGGIRRSNPDWEDTCQEARLRRWQSRDRPLRVQYAAIRNCTVDIIRLRLGRQNQKFNFATAVPIQTDEYTLPIPSGETQDTILDSVLVDEALKVLTPREAAVVWAWACGYPMEEISLKLGYSTSWASYLIKGCLSKMRKEIAA